MKRRVLVFLWVPFVAFMLWPELEVPFESMLQSTVMVSDSYGHATGVMIEDGLIVTAGHVVENVPTYVQFCDDTVAEVTGIWRHPEYDVGFLWVDPNDWACAALTSSDVLKLGDEVFHVGTPLDPGLRHSLFKGIVTYLMRDWDVWEDGMQIDAWAAPGCSGGPVFDSQGRLVGIVVGGPNRNGACAVIVETSEHIQQALEDYEAEKDKGSSQAQGVISKG